jgi:hypothetical protein
MTGTQVSGVRRSERVVKMFCCGNDEPGWPPLRELRKFWTMADASDGAVADALGKKDESVKFLLGIRKRKTRSLRPSLY